MTIPETATILIVDDDAEQRRATAITLRKQNYSVAEAADGPAGLALARALLPDLILSDIRMPELSGYDMLSELRGDAGASAIPVILMTGHPDLNGLRHGMKLGADDYLPKPFSVNDLLAAVKARLTKQKILKQKAEAKLANLRTQISTMLPHELLTPLTGILGIAELMNSDSGSLSQNEINRFGAVLKDSGERLHQLIQRFLTYVQVEMLCSDASALARARSEPLQDHAITVRAACLAAARKAGRSSDLSLAVQQLEWPMATSNVRLVVGELVANAFKFSAPGQTVSVTAPTATLLAIQDLGSGMDELNLQEIGAFSQFNRHIHQQRGAGLGIIIAKRLVEAHGGTFRIDSAVGKGCSITLSFEDDFKAAKRPIQPRPVSPAPA